MLLRQNGFKTGPISVCLCRAQLRLGEEFNKKRLQQAIEARASASDPQVLSWLNRHIEELTAAVERESRDEDDDERGSRFG